jgi:hypothetical protein
MDAGALSNDGAIDWLLGMKLSAYRQDMLEFDLVVQQGREE